MKKFASTLGLLVLMLVVTSFTTPTEIGGKSNPDPGMLSIGGKSNPDPGMLSIGGKSNPDPGM